jgi:triphosphatase
VSTEIELKLEIDSDDLPLVLGNPLLANAESQVTHQVTVYYDTPETKLKKEGFTLRVRSTKGRFVQTIKATTNKVGLISREELECEVPSLEPDLSSLPQHPIQALVGADGEHSLEGVIHSEVNRTSWLIDQANCSFQVDLDHGTIVAGGRSSDFVELEFELRDGPPVGLIMAARRLSDYAPVRLGVLTKAERGFQLAADELGKVHKAQPVTVDPGMTVAQAFETIVHACLKHYRLNEPIVLRATKANALHQARVAMRRLRSAFTLFRPAVEDVEFQHLRNELRWFTAQLGDARNLDVYLERDLPHDERDRLIRKRERMYEHVVDTMNSHKFRRLLIDLVGWTAIGAWRTGKVAQRPIESFANHRLDRLWKSVAAAGRDVTGMDEPTRHRLRIQVKKLRYAVEFLQGIYTHFKAAEKRFAVAVADLQESLGKLNDLATAKEFGATQIEETWLIGSPRERRNLISTQDALRDVLRTGPFWRAQEKVERP